MSRAEHLIENALISVTHQEDIESYVIYTWGKE